MQSPEHRQDDIQAKAHAWQKRYDEALDRVISNPESTPEELIDVIWNQGILDRIAPLDPQEREARIANRSDVWEGNREDPELYLRIMYAIGMSEEFSRRGYSAGGGSYVAGIGQAIGEITHFQNPSVYKRLLGDQVENFFVNLNQKIKDRAADVMRTHGGSPHDPLIPWRAQGSYKGIPVMIDRYSGDGGVTLTPMSDHPQDRMRLGEMTNYRPVSPSELNQQDFYVPEPPDHLEHELEIDGGRKAGNSMRRFADVLSTKYIREEYERDWVPLFHAAVRGHDGKRIVLKMTFDKQKGLSFEASEI